MICKAMIKRAKGQTAKEELHRELTEVKNKQITEPDFMYDGENHLVKMGSERYLSFIHLLENNFERMTFRRHKHFICLTCWQFIGVMQKAKHDSLLHKTIEP